MRLCLFLVTTFSIGTAVPSTAVAHNVRSDGASLNAPYFCRQLRLLPLSGAPVPHHGHRPGQLAHWGSVASIAGAILSVLALGASAWAAWAATNAEHAAKRAEQTTARKLLLFSTASTAHHLNEIDDAIRHRDYKAAAILARHLADYMDTIAATEQFTGASGFRIPKPEEWRQIATELREWDMQIRLFTAGGSSRAFDQMEAWCQFTARIKPMITAATGFLNP